MKNRWLVVAGSGVVAACGMLLLIGLAGRGLFPFETHENRLSVGQGDALRIPSGDRDPPSAETFRPGWAVDEQEAITEIQTISADQVTDEVKPDELVLGVEIGGQARAYSINTMSGPHREIFNDVLADRPIAATW